MQLKLLPFGWNIFDTKRTVGGLFGYSSVKTNVSLNVPSSNGVSWGLVKSQLNNRWLILQKSLQNYEQ